MSCSAQFPNDISLSCVFGLIADIKNGINVQTVKKALWIVGCIIEKVGPPTLPQKEEEVSTMMFADDIDVLVGKLEATAYNLAERETDEVSVQAAPPVASVEGWEVLIPIIFEIIKLIIENRKKKQEPTPAPTPAPTTRPAVAESLTEPSKKSKK